MKRKSKRLWMVSEAAFTRAVLELQRLWVSRITIPLSGVDSRGRLVPVSQHILVSSSSIRCKNKLFSNGSSGSVILDFLSQSELLDLRLLLSVAESHLGAGSIDFFIDTLTVCSVVQPGLI